MRPSLKLASALAVSSARAAARAPAGLPSRWAGKPMPLAKLKAVERIIDYSFKDHALLCEALCTEQDSHRLRLAIIGDKAVSMALAHVWYPRQEIDRAVWTLIHVAAVTNARFAEIGFAHGLHECTIPAALPVSRRCSSWPPQDPSRAVAPEFMARESDMADVVEAILGAVSLDSDSRDDLIRVVERLHIVPTIFQAAAPPEWTLHPVTTQRRLPQPFFNGHHLAFQARLSELGSAEQPIPLVRRVDGQVTRLPLNEERLSRPAPPPPPPPTVWDHVRNAIWGAPPTETYQHPHSVEGQGVLSVKLFEGKPVSRVPALVIARRGSPVSLRSRMLAKRGLQRLGTSSMEPKKAPAATVLKTMTPMSSDQDAEKMAEVEASAPVQGQPEIPTPTSSDKDKDSASKAEVKAPAPVKGQPEPPTPTSSDKDKDSASKAEVKAPAPAKGQPELPTPRTEAEFAAKIAEAQEGGAQPRLQIPPQTLTRGAPQASNESEPGQPKPKKSKAIKPPSKADQAMLRKAIDQFTTINNTFRKSSNVTKRQIVAAAKQKQKILRGVYHIFTKLKVPKMVKPSPGAKLDKMLEMEREWVDMAQRLFLESDHDSEP